MPQESEDNKDMLPDDIVQVLAAREKYVMFFKLSSFLDYICVHANTLTMHNCAILSLLFCAGNFFRQTLRKRRPRKDILQERKNQKALGKDF